MKLRNLLIAAFLLVSSSAFAGGQQFVCSVFETNENGEVSSPLHTRSVPIPEVGNAQMQLKGRQDGDYYMGYDVEISSTRDWSQAKISFYVSANDSASGVGSLMDLRSENRYDVNLVVNARASDGRYVASVRLSCNVQ